jgi:hypothetical protein
MGSLPNFATFPDLAPLVPTVVAVPLCTREAYAAATGLPIGVVNAHADRGYLPTVRVGKYSMVNLEALRIAAGRRAEEFTL